MMMTTKSIPSHPSTVSYCIFGGFDERDDELENRFVFQTGGSYNL